MDLQLILRIAAGIGIAIVAFFLLRLVFKVLGKAAKLVIILVLIAVIAGVLYYTGALDSIVSFFQGLL